MNDRDLLIALTLALVAGNMHGTPDEIVECANRFLVALNQPKYL